MSTNLAADPEQKIKKDALGSGGGDVDGRGSGTPTDGQSGGRPKRQRPPSTPNATKKSRKAAEAAVVDHARTTAAAAAAAAGREVGAAAEPASVCMWTCTCPRCIEARIRLTTPALARQVLSIAEVLQVTGWSDTFVRGITKSGRLKRIPDLYDVHYSQKALDEFFATGGK